MSLRFNIFAKGLALVGIPLTCALGLVGTLIYLNGQAETEIKLEAHAQKLHRDVGTIAESVMFAAYDGTEFRDAQLMVQHGTMFHNMVAPKVQEYYQRYTSSLQRADQALAEASELVHASNDPVETAQLNKLAAAYQDARGIIVRATMANDPMGTLFPIKHFLRDDHPFRIMRFAADRMLTEEMKVLQQRQKAVAQTSAAIQAVLGGSIIFVVALAIGLTYLLTKQVTGRLRILMDNTVRLAKRQQLHPVVGGTDEIAELDKVLHTTADELAELEKFKKELSAMVTHELRTPLTSIYGVLALMRAEAFGKMPPVALDKAKIAEQNATRLLRLINDLLEIERMESGKLEMNLKPTDLDAVIAQSVEAVREFGAQKSIAFDVEKSDCTIIADGERLSQVVINLLSNAVKYSPDHTSVSVRFKQLDGFCEVLICDQGRGIPPEFKDKVFERFQQVDKSDAKDKKSSGLGLAICKAIVELHGGAIGVDSTVGQGSTFWFTVRLAAVAETTEQPATAPTAMDAV